MSTVLAPRPLPLERAAAHVPVHRARRIEVVCHGLLFLDGIQVAVDPTKVSLSAQPYVTERCTPVQTLWSAAAAHACVALGCATKTTVSRVRCAMRKDPVERHHLCGRSTSCARRSLSRLARFMTKLPDLSRLCTSSSRAPADMEIRMPRRMSAEKKKKYKKFTNNFGSLGQGISSMYNVMHDPLLIHCTAIGTQNTIIITPTTGLKRMKKIWKPYTAKRRAVFQHDPARIIIYTFLMFKLVVVGIKVGGRFGAEAAAFPRKLAVARAREMAARLRTATRQASLHLWMGMPAIAAQRALAHSLPELPLAGVDACSAEPPLGQLLAEARGTHCMSVGQPSRATSARTD